MASSLLTVAILICTFTISVSASSTNSVDDPPKSPFPPFSSEKFNKTKLHVGALLPFLLTHDKLMFHAAMYSAVRLINNDTNILKDYELVLDYKETTVGFMVLLRNCLNTNIALSF